MLNSADVGSGTIRRPSPLGYTTASTLAPMGLRAMIKRSRVPRRSEKRDTSEEVSANRAHVSLFGVFSCLMHERSFEQKWRKRALGARVHLPRYNRTTMPFRALRAQPKTQSTKKSWRWARACRESPPRLNLWSSSGGKLAMLVVTCEYHSGPFHKINSQL